jgi:hypothetical protein
VEIARDFFSLSKASSRCSAPYAMDNGSFSLDVRRSGFEADRLPQSNAEVKNERSCAFTPPTHLYGLYRENVYKHYRIFSARCNLMVLYNINQQNAHFLL